MVAPFGGNGRAHRTRRLSSAWILLAIIASESLSADFFVDAVTGADANDGLTWATAKETVPAAFALVIAQPGSDTVFVAEGIYPGTHVVPADVMLIGGFPTGGGPRDWELHQTILDGQGDGPILTFGVGTDACVLDGFVIRGGWVQLMPTAGIHVVAASPLIQNCRIEGNEARGPGSAAAMMIDVPSGPLPRIRNVTISRNRFWGHGAAVVVQSHGNVSATATPVLADCIVERNECISTCGFMNACGAVSLLGAAAIERVAFRDNLGDGLSIGSGATTALVSLTDSEFSGNACHGISISCAPQLTEVSNVTSSGNGTGGIYELGNSCFDPYVLTLRRSIIWDEAASFCSGCAGESSITRGGWLGQPSTDPLFTGGPHGDYYLSHVASGQAIDSPAVDAGIVTAASVGLDARTTRADSAPDANAVDLGVHHRPVGSLSILRAETPAPLNLHAAVTALPFVDFPGLLSDSTLPLLFYSVEPVSNEIRVVKDTASDSVRIEFCDGSGC